MRRRSARKRADDYRLIQALFLSPGSTLAQGVIVDMFFANERGRRIVSTASITRIA
jgi:hypothetical protein